MSDGKLEQVLSTLGTIKVNKRSRLTNQSLDDLLLLNSASILDPALIYGGQPSPGDPPRKRERNTDHIRGSNQPRPSTSSDVG